MASKLTSREALNFALSLLLYRHSFFHSSQNKKLFWRNSWVPRLHISLQIWRASNPKSWPRDCSLSRPELIRLSAVRTRRFLCRHRWRAIPTCPSTCKSVGLRHRSHMLRKPHLYDVRSARLPLPSASTRARFVITGVNEVRHPDAWRGQKTIQFFGVSDYLSHFPIIPFR